MTYRIRIDHAPAYELIMSLDAYLVTPSQRNMDLGEGWAAETRAKLPPALIHRLAAVTEAPDYRWLGLLVQLAPSDEARTAQGYLRWLGQLSAGDLYDLLAPHANDQTPLPQDLGRFRDGAIDLLSGWHEAYFVRVQDRLQAHLAAAAAKAVQSSERPDPALAVEELSRGYYVNGWPGLGEIRLVPQYHKRPITLTAAFTQHLTFYYPSADLPKPAGQPDSELMRLVRTLSDESRLRILHALGGQTLSFNDVVTISGLTKGTVHRHLWALRFANLLRYHYPENTFTLRPGALNRISEALNQFVSNR